MRKMAEEVGDDAVVVVERLAALARFAERAHSYWCILHVKSHGEAYYSNIVRYVTILQVSRARGARANL